MKPAYFFCPRSSHISDVQTQAADRYHLTSEDKFNVWTNTVTTHRKHRLHSLHPDKVNLKCKHAS